jgi:hypothetical protein
MIERTTGPMVSAPADEPALPKEIEEYVEELEASDVGGGEFGDNLAEVMEKADLATLAYDLIEMFAADSESREDWIEGLVKGLDQLGLKIEERSEPWMGACGVYHPLLAEAIVRFEAQAIMEIFPAQGPVKTQTIGIPSEDKEERAARVQEDMNYTLTDKMSEYRAETERLLWSLGLMGSAFRKCYWDTTLQRPRAMFVPATDLIAAYGTSDIQSCPRITHVIKLPQNEVRKLMATGFYKEMDLDDPEYFPTDIQKKLDDLQGWRSNSTTNDRRELLEMHVDINLADYTDKEKDDGIDLPYVITIDKQSAKILSIRRNWAEDDKLKKRRSHFADYVFMPGFGFYGFGLVHLIGGSAKAATAITRQLVDAGTLSNLPGGLKARGLRIKGDDTPIKPGEFRDVDVPSGAIRDSITFLPYKEPSAVLFQLLGAIVEDGRRFASVSSDVQVGDMNQQAPVGTTLAILERSMKVMSAVQARLHASLRKEFKLLRDIIRDNMSDEYEYDVAGGARTIKKSDYADDVDVIPVSDPNATTYALRVMQYQTALQLAAQMPPGIMDAAALARGFMEVISLPNADDVVPAAKTPVPKDPVTENMDVMTGKPAKAFIWQDHESHLAVHMAAMQDPKLQQIFGTNQAVIGALTAHIAEHVAFAYRRNIERQLGVNLPAPETVLSPEIETRIAQLAAPAADALLKRDQAEGALQQQMQQNQDPLIQMQKQELALKAQELQAKQQETQLKYQTQRENAQAKDQLEKLRIITQAQAVVDQTASRERIAGAQIGQKAGAELVSRGQRLPKEGV